MSEKVAQATATPDSGASNANDFQPTTRNPQTAPVNLFQQQNGLQNVTNTQELLSDNQNARISVIAEPAPQPPAVAEANETPYGFIFLAVLLVAATVLLVAYKRRSAKTAAPAVEPSASEAVATTKQRATPKKKTKKTTAKKSSRKRR